jgi:hypothetical protein
LISQSTVEKNKFNKENTTAGTRSGCEQALGHELRVHMLTIKLIDCSKYSLNNTNYTGNTTASTGSACEQAQGHELWAHMFTIKLFDSTEIKWKIKILQGNNHCRYRQQLWANPGPWAVGSHAHNQANWYLKTQLKKTNLTKRIPLSVPAVAVSKPWVTSCELTCAQSSSLIDQNTVEKNKINKVNTTTGIGNDCEQAQGHELWAQMHTIKLFDNTKLACKNNFL